MVLIKSVGQTRARTCDVPTDTGPVACSNQLSHGLAQIFRLHNNQSANDHLAAVVSSKYRHTNGFTNRERRSMAVQSDEREFHNRHVVTVKYSKEMSHSECVVSFCCDSDCKFPLAYISNPNSQTKLELLTIYVSV